jgi:hypothetical protein
MPRKPRVYKYRLLQIGWVCETAEPDPYGLPMITACGTWRAAIDHAIAWWRKGRNA